MKREIHRVTIPESKQGLVIGSSIRNAVGTEKHPPHIDNKKCKDDSEVFSDLLQYIEHKSLVHQDKQSMKDTPKNKVPSGTMPKSRTQEHNEKIQISSTHRTAVSTKGNIEIFFHKATLVNQSPMASATSFYMAAKAEEQIKGECLSSEVR